MFATKDINKFFDIDIAMSNDMVNSIELWNKILENKQPWLSKEKGVKSLALAQGIGEELSKTSTRELISKVISNDFVNQEYQEFIKDMNENLQWALGEGGVVFKPYVSDNQIFVDVVHADKFFPVTFNGRKKITAGFFVEQIFKGKNVYTRLEYQKYENGVNTFENYAFMKRDYSQGNYSFYTDFGNQIPLDTIPEWKDLEEHFEIGGVDRPLFSYFKTPVINTIDKMSPLGVPCYVKAINLIRDAEEQYSRYIWEFIAGEMAVEASGDAFEIDSHTHEPKLPEGKKRLYRTYDIDNSSGQTTNINDLIKVHAPQLRDANYAAGFNDILKRIEFECGLSYGDLSDPQQVDKTAEEIKSSKQRKYDTVSAIQENLNTVLEDVAYAMNVYAIGMGKSNSMECVVETDWGDSILTDTEKQRNIDLQEVNAGLMPEWKYKVKWQGMSEEEAKREVAENSDEGIEYDDDEDDDTEEDVNVN